MKRLDTKAPWLKFLSWSLSIIIFIIALMLSIPYLLAGAAVYFFYANEKSIEKHEVILDKRYAPILNPHPKYFFTIKGHIDKELMKTMHPRFYADYETFNDQCKRVLDSFVGSGPRSFKLTFDPMNKQGDFDFKIPIDKYLPGKCKWQLSGISYSNNIDKKHENETYTSIADFTDKSARQINQDGFVFFVCNIIEKCQMKKYQNFTTHGDEGLATNINYHYTLR